MGGWERMKAFKAKGEEKERVRMGIRCRRGKVEDVKNDYLMK